MIIYFPCFQSRRVYFFVGMDVVQAIEKSKTDRSDKPVKDIKIVNIEVL